MESPARIETALQRALARSGEDGAPPILATALRQAVFPGGARVRPQLCLAVAAACGDDSPALTDAASAALELMHCASLVHDDLPCFDDADLRRGRPTVHILHGEPVALLTGDSLIILAFETLARAGAAQPQRLVALIRALGAAAGMPGGLCAGQGWESEETIDLERYHAAKTGSLFTAATSMGAIAAGRDPGPWRALGMRLGLAYQVADDLRDALLTPEELGKPAGRDEGLGRPSAVRELGVPGALASLGAHLAAAIDSVPDCPGGEALRDLVRLQAKRLTPKAAPARVA